MDRGQTSYSVPHGHAQQPVVLQLGGTWDRSREVPQSSGGKCGYRDPRRRPSGGLCQNGAILWRQWRGPVRNPADLRPALERGLKYVKEKQLPYLVDVIAEPR